MFGKLRIAFLAATVMLAAFTAAYILTQTCEPVQTSAIVPMTEVPAIQAFRTERESMRAMQKAQLNDIIHDSATDEAVRAEAQRQMLELLERIESEKNTEAILAARGYRGATVIENGECVNVLIDSEAVTARQCAAILDIVCTEMAVKSGNVKIIPAAKGSSGA